MNRQIIHLYNYKQYADTEFVIPENANVIIVTGDNEMGKTGLITSVKECNMLQEITQEPLKRGEKEGRITYITKDINGDEITIVHEFFAEKKSRFYAIKNGKRINELYKIRELIGNCIQFSVPEISMKLSSEKTRKEVIDQLIKPLVSEEVLKQINYHNAKIATLFAERRDTNRELETFKSTLSTVTVSEESKALIGKKEEATKLKEELEKEVSRYTDAEERIAKVDQKILDDTKVLVGEVALLKSSEESQKTSVSTLETEIKQLEDQIRLKQTRLVTERKSLETTTSSIETKEKEIKKISDDLMVQKTSDTMMIENEKETYESLKTRIKKGQEILDSISKIETSISTIAPIECKVKELQERYDQKDKELEQNREAIKTIIKASPLPEGLSIDDDGIKIDGLIFDENQVSESSLYLKLVELLCKVNTSKFIHAGKYDAYGSSRFSELCRIAQENGKTVWLENVVSGQNEVKVSCLINGDSSKVYSPEEILKLDEEQDNKSLF